MRKNTLNKYMGTYEIVREPRSLKPHNHKTWGKIKAHINSTEEKNASFDKLNIMAKRHLHHGETSGNPYQFVIYCINCGWLARIQT